MYVVVKCIEIARTAVTVERIFHIPTTNNGTYRIGEALRVLGE